MKQLKDKHFKNLNQFSPNLLTLNIDSNYNIISDKTIYSLIKMTQLRAIQMSFEIKETIDRRY